jgi:hypothetical protein
MAGGGLTFTGLTGGEYWAAAEVGEEWRYVRFATQTLVQLSGYSSVNAGVITAEDPATETTIDIIEGIEVPESGRLGASYFALFSVEDFVVLEGEAKGSNFGHLYLYLDDDPVSAVFGEPPPVTAKNFIDGNTGNWWGVRSSLEGYLEKLAAEGSEDAPANGPFYGSQAIPIAAAPGTHDLSVRAKPGEPEGGKLSFKERRLVAVTGTV